VVFVVRRHWTILTEPILTTLASGILMVFLVWALGEKFADLANIIFIAWLVVLGRLVFHIIEWHDSWFGSTQRRLMLIHGLVTRKVAMMPLEKVTDMSYGRSPMGQLLGYGEFVLESAGQEQALRSVTHVPHPDQLYRLLLSTMFIRTTSGRAAPSPTATKDTAVPAPSPRPAPAPEGAKAPREFPWQERIAEFLSHDDEPTVRTPTGQVDPRDD
jgi:membrane protein YdbS with pleckstrin-like domain